MKSPKPTQNTAFANQWHSYLRGWTDAAKLAVMRPAFTTHRNEQIRNAYDTGYTDGSMARHTATKAATKLYHYSPSIIRVGLPADNADQAIVDQIVAANRPKPIKKA